MRSHKGIVQIVIPAVIVALIGVIVYLLVQNPAEERLNPPKPIFVADPNNNNRFCPNSLSFNSLPSEVDFKITYKNLGDKDSILTATLSSNNQSILFRYEGDFEGFRNVASKSWVADTDTFQTFDFEIKMNATEHIKNFTVNTQLTCSYDTTLQKNVACGEIARCCKYEKEGFSNSYSLVSETC